MFCGQDSLIGIGQEDVAISRLYCRSWQCDECMPRRLMKLRELAASGEPTTLITFTSNTAAFDNPVDAAKALVRTWRNVRQYLEREAGRPKIPFIAVVEGTKKGWPHLHILARMPYISQAKLSQLAFKYMRSPVVDIRRVYNRRHASRYIAKYVSKGPDKYEGCKRYWRSQDYDLTDPNHTHENKNPRFWFRERQDADYLVWTLQKCDWHHRNPGESLAVLEPLAGARWLWFEHGPPPQTEVSPCQPLQ